MEAGGSKLGWDRLQTVRKTEHPAITHRKMTFTPFIAELWAEATNATGQKERTDILSIPTWPHHSAMTLGCTQDFTKKLPFPSERCFLTSQTPQSPSRILTPMVQLTLFIFYILNIFYFCVHVCTFVYCYTYVMANMWRSANTFWKVFPSFPHVGARTEPMLSDSLTWQANTWKH